MKSLISSFFLLLSLYSLSNAQLPQYLTPHFSAWLKANGYGGFGFERTDLSGGSFGGKQDDNDEIVNEPVIFFHGNSDRAIGGPNDKFNGFANTIQFLLSQGYKESELYITTWGPADVDKATEQYHSYEYLNYLRSFTEAVLKYTNAKKVDIISHSMGVTLGRKVINGGKGYDDVKPYDLGPSLAEKVDTFLGISGGNWGLTDCYLVPGVPTCGTINGFYPGMAPSLVGPVELSFYLEDLNMNGHKEGDYVFSMFSVDDDLIKYGGMVYGKFTSKIPREDGSKTFDKLGHMDMKTKTVQDQFNAITKHKF